MNTNDYGVISVGMIEAPNKSNAFLLTVNSEVRAYVLRTALSTVSIELSYRDFSNSDRNKMTFIILSGNKVYLSVDVDRNADHLNWLDLIDQKKG